MCFLNHRSIRKILGYRREVKKTILLPAAASAVMGAAAVGVYKLIHLGIQSNASLHPGGRGCCRGGLRSPSGEAWLPGRGRAAPDARRDQALQMFRKLRLM